jgi:glycosyltransferase involved in cell wall biosynthesis
MQKLRVAIVTETYPPEINGVAVTIDRVVRGLEERDHFVELVRPRQHAQEIPALRRNFAESLHRGIPIPRYDALKLGFPAGAALQQSWTVCRPDVVHLVTEGPLGWSALKAARRLGIPVSSDFHTNFHIYTQHYGIGWLRKPIEAYLRHFHNQTLCTMVPTGELREQLELLGLRNLLVVGRGVDTRLFNPAKRNDELRRSWGVGPGDPAVLYVGRLAPEKNLPTVVESFYAMHAVNPRARLVFVGDGPERGALQSRHPTPVYAGMLTGETLAAHYASADIFLFPSVTETYGNVTMEALASGLAAVAYDYAAAAEHIHHEVNGLIAPFGDAATFARQAIGLVNDAPRIARLRVNARATAEKLDWSTVIGEFEDALRMCIESEFGNYATSLSA